MPTQHAQVVQEQYFWNSMREDIGGYISHCEACQTSTAMVTADQAMHPMPVLPKGESWHVDLIGPL